MEIRPYEERDGEGVVALWRTCGLVMPWNDPFKDIERKLRVQPEMFLVGFLRGELVATVMAGYEGHRGWVNYLAVAPECRGQGLGRRMMEAAEERLRAFGCPKVNLQVRKSNPSAAGFYRALGYAEDESVSMGKRLVDD